MIKAFIIIPAAVLFAAAGSQMASAQTTQTEEALLLNYQLTAVSQGPTTTTSSGVGSDVIVSTITSRDIIRAIGASTGNTFSGRARLILITPTNNLENWTVQVQDGSNSVDVTGFLVHQPGSASVGSAWVSNRTGAAADTEYSIDGFGLQDQGGLPGLGEHFSVSGFTASTIKGLVNRRGQVSGELDSIQADVSGTGDINGQLIIVEGTVSAESIGTVTVVTQPIGPD